MREADQQSEANQPVGVTRWTPAGFILDFAGGDLPYFIDTPESVEIDVKVSTGQVKQTFLFANPELSRFRSGVDVDLRCPRLSNDQSTLRAHGGL
jgi:glucans biosynthesis protein